MNWKENKKKYPKSCYLLEKYLGGHKKDDYSSHEFEYIINGLNYKDEYFEPQTLGLRSLYDFFDEQEIYIEIGIDCTMEAKYAPIINFIDRDDITWDWENWQDKYLWRTRTEAEGIAFLKAFEILEEKQL